MTKIKVEILRDASNIPTSVTIGRKFKVTFSTDTGFIIEGKRRDLPSFSEILRLVYPVQIEPLPVNTRDVKESYALSGNQTVNMKDDFLATGLDIFIHNRGASSLSFAVDGGASTTINAGDVFTQNDVEFEEIIVTSAVAYDMILAGIKYETQQRRVP